MCEICQIQEGVELKREIYFVGQLYKPKTRVQLQPCSKVGVSQCPSIPLTSVITVRLSTDHISVSIQAQTQVVVVCICVWGGVCTQALQPRFMNNNKKDWM